MPRHTCPALISSRPLAMLRSFNSIVARFFVGHGARIPESWWRRVGRRDQHRMMGRFPVDPYLFVNRLGLRRF
jgi:hypothetical protein